MKKWFIKSDNGFTRDNFRFNNEFSYITAQLLANRNISYKNVKKFLNPSYDQLHNPFLLKDLDNAIDVLIEAIDNNLHIHIVGDYDQDGNSSTVVLYKGLSYFTNNISYSIPHRVEDGYGISKEIISRAKENNVDIIITCDNGITAFEQVDYCNSLGIQIIVTDHHQVLVENGIQKIPNAVAVVNPHRTDCHYPFKELCGAGVAFKVLQALYSELGEDEDQLIDLIQFVAMGTVCDVVDLVDENRFFVKKGLELLNHTTNSGFNSLSKLNNVTKVTASTLGFKIGPCINAAGRLDSANIGVQLFLEEDKESTDKYAKKLIDTFL